MNGRMWRAIALVLILPVFFLSGCGKKEEGKTKVPELTKVAKKSAERETPGVPPEMGGAGFAQWLVETGDTSWETAVATISGNPNAIKGGKLRMAMQEFPATLRTEGKDSNSAFVSSVSGLLYEPLLTLDTNTLEIVSSLATHWKISEDKMTFSFRINPEARWSDGAPVTADDVFATWSLLVDEGILFPSSNILYSKYEAPVAESPYLFSVTTKEENWRHFLYFGISMAILPAHVIGGLDGGEYLEEFQFKMVPGTGPYELLNENIDKGRSLVITRRDDWWGAGLAQNVGLYNFDEIEWSVIMDERLWLEKFKKGELDVYVVGRASWWVDEFNYDEIERGVCLKRKIFNEDIQGISGLAFNMREWPFDDIRIRQAFAHLYDRDKLIEKLFHGEYLKLYSYFPSSVYENPDNIKYDFDPEKARQLLAEAGYKERNSDGWLVNDEGQILELTLTFDSPSWERIHTVLQEGLQHAGIKLNLKQLTSTTQFQNNMDHNFKLAFQAWTGLLWPNPNSTWHSDVADVTPSTNICGVKDAVIDSLAFLYDNEYDQGKRETLMRAMDYRLSEIQPYSLAWYGPFSRIVFWNKFGYPEGYLSRTGDYLGIQSLWYIDPEREENMEKAIADPSIKLPAGEVKDHYWLKKLGKM